MFRGGDEERLFAFLRERAEGEKTVRAYLRWGHWAIMSDDPDSARTAILTAIAIDDGQSVEPYLAAADLAQRLGDLDEAVRRLRQAYTIAPTDQRVTSGLESMGEVPGPTIGLPPGP